MRFLIALVLLVLPFIATADTNLGELTAAELNLSAVDLADTPTSAAIAMDLRTNEAPSYPHYNQLTLLVQVTAGTTTRVTVRCKGGQAANGSDAAWASVCYPGASASDPISCGPDLRTFLMADGAAFKSEWKVATRYVWCELDDPDDGTGTATVVARRSLQ